MANPTSAVHIALYRSWRPQSFGDMVGQPHIVRTLKNAIREQRIAHAYLFNGPRGTGKTTAAKIFAKAINCTNSSVEDEPCNECAACIGITNGSIMDVIELDAASNRGIDEIRDIRDKVRYAPSDVKYKVYIIDEIHMLTNEAFNALLKTLEEPPPHVIFILATTEPHKIPATIISRCQRFDFHQVTHAEQVQRLQEICEAEGIAAEHEALAYIARLSGGGMRDAISLLEQCASSCDGPLTVAAAVDVTGGIEGERFAELCQAIASKDVAQLFQVIESFIRAGKDAQKVLEHLIFFMRDLIVVKLAPQDEGSASHLLKPGQLNELSQLFELDALFTMIDTLNHYQAELRHTNLPQTILEVALLRITVLDRTQAAESSLRTASVAPVSPATSSSSLDVDTLKRQLYQLEQRFTQLVQSAPRTTPAPPRPAFQQVSKGQGQPFQARPYYKFVEQSDEELTKSVQSKWANILQHVNKVRIPAKALLADSTPVAVHEQQVLLAFRNSFHRESTEKDGTRELVVQALSEVCERPLTFVTILKQDWESMTDDPNAALKTPITPEQALADAESEAAAKEGAGEQPWVEEALAKFGADVVTIKD